MITNNLKRKIIRKRAEQKKTLQIHMRTLKEAFLFQLFFLDVCSQISVISESKLELLFFLQNLDRQLQYKSKQSLRERERDRGGVIIVIRACVL